MISAARLIAHQTVNGRYQSKMQMDQFPVLGHSMTVSDIAVTDLAMCGLTEFQTAFYRFVHYRQCKLRNCAVQWPQIDRERTRRLP